MNIEQFLETINPTLWVIGNILLAYVAIVMTTFVGAYFFFSNWRATRAGRSVLAFTASLLGLVFLVVLGIFFSQTTEWYQYPNDVYWWRPIIRDAIYVGIAISVTRLTYVLFASWRSPLPEVVELTKRPHRPHVGEKDHAPV